VGDLITMDRQLIELGSGLVAGKALDDRASVAAAVLCLEQLSRTNHLWDVVAVATVQEEVGLKGATTSAYGLQPDIGIAIDVTFGKQPGAPEDQTYELGKGPTIGCGPNFHPKVQAALVNAAKDLELPFHIEPDANGGTDAWAIQISRQGIPTGLISIPVRNMHTPVETVAVKDVERAGRLLASFVGGLDERFLDSLKWSLFEEE
jgi:endoglucanase